MQRCLIHDYINASGRCPFCVFERDVGYLHDRFDALRGAIDNASVRTDLTSDQADRQDTTLTELESHLLDQQDAHNNLVAYAERLNDARIEDQGEMRDAYNHCLVEVGDLRRRVAGLESRIEDMSAERGADGRTLRADLYGVLDYNGSLFAAVEADNRSLTHRVGELEDQLGLALRLFREHGHVAL